MDDLARFRRERRLIPLKPYDLIEIGPQHLAADFRRKLDRQLLGPVVIGGRSIPSLDPPIDWTAHNASFAFHLNAWNPIGPLLIGYSQFGDKTYFDKAWAFALSWLEEYQVPAFDIGPEPLLLEEAHGESAWYDMAAGHRAYRIAYFLDIVSRDSNSPNRDVALLRNALDFHLQLLAREDFFRRNDNHGFYQAIGALAAIRRFPHEPLARGRGDAAIARVTAAIHQQFHPSGIHREHSPGYHFMVLFTLIGARQSGLLAGNDLDRKLKDMEEAFSWMLDGAGQIATIGDTDPRSFAGPHPALTAFSHPWLRWQLSGGKEGTPPPSGLFADRDAGWVFARGGAARRDWWYFAQIAAFHSRFHKHADDLSFVWSDRGVQVLIDPARYGYSGSRNVTPALSRLGFRYGDPKRIYIEETRAHNAVEIDRQSQDRTREPHGSALLGARIENGLVISECQLRFDRLLKHWRAIVLMPGRFLFVLDWLRDRSGTPHGFRQYFQFAPDWIRDETQEPLSMVREGMRLAVLPLAPGQPPFASVRGQGEPGRQGWYSGKASSLSPCTSAFCEALDVPSATFATLFTFGAGAEPGPSRAKASMRASRFAWSEDGIDHALEIARHTDGGPVTVVFRRASVLPGDGEV